MRVFAIIAAVFWTGLCGAAPRELSGSEKDAVMEKISVYNASAKTLQADFTQVKNSSMLSSPLTSRGQLSFAAPGKVRWEVLSPVQKVSVFDSSDRRFALFNFDFSQFISAVSDDGEKYEVRLSPTGRDMAKLFRALILTCLKSSGQVTGVILVDTEGDTTQLQFSNIRRDCDIDPKIFENATR
ncbi:MAG: outer membrane lipoprotein carrier protein LolA [Bacteroidales bacterium]|nr:outer membrane lipoprotein carrier protein LolA [Bacteroidales bacterium]